MDLLAYWQWNNYQHDLDVADLFHFNSKRSRLHDVLRVGERLWLVSGRPGPEGVEYILAQRLHVMEKTRNSPRYEFGAYRVVGDPDKTLTYRGDGPDMTAVLYHLRFEPYKPLQVKAKKDIAMALRVMRKLAPGDVESLERWSESLEVAGLPSPNLRR